MNIFKNSQTSLLVQQQVNRSIFHITLTIVQKSYNQHIGLI